MTLARLKDKQRLLGMTFSENETARELLVRVCAKAGLP